MFAHPMLNFRVDPFIEVSLVWPLPNNLVSFSVLSQINEIKLLAPPPGVVSIRQFL